MKKNDRTFSDIKFFKSYNPKFSKTTGKMIPRILLISFSAFIISGIPLSALADGGALPDSKNSSKNEIEYISEEDHINPQIEFNADSKPGVSANSQNDFNSDSTADFGETDGVIQSENAMDEEEYTGDVIPYAKDAYCIKFGKYEQDGNPNNGKEDIEWRVIKFEQNRVLLMSRYALDYCTKSNSKWEYCSLRTWLNNDFINSAFTEKERRLIPTVTVINNDNAHSGTDGGRDTQDRIFCLSADELVEYLGYSYYDTERGVGFSQNALCEPSQVVVDQGAEVFEVTEHATAYYYHYYNDDALGVHSVDWWLRTPGFHSDGTQIVRNDGYVTAGMMKGNGKGKAAVRPVMYLEWKTPSGIGLTYDSLTLQKGETRVVSAVVAPEDAADKTVKWTSENPSVASVDAKGTVKAVSAGSTKITAQTVNGIKKTIPVKVIINPTSIELEPASAVMICGDELQFEAKLAPEDVTEKNITWSISNPKIGSVNGGKVKIWDAGIVTITAKTSNGLVGKASITAFADDVPENIFADIKYNTWQYRVGKAVYDKGIMGGKGKIGTRIIMAPNVNMTRAEFVTALYGMDGRPEVSYSERFTDVPEGQWYSLPVTWAAENVIVAGNPDGTFGISGNATREQIALILYKYAAYKNYDVTIDESVNLDKFTDADTVDGWALQAIRWAVSRGIINGKGSASEGFRIDPRKGATRIECAAMFNTFDDIYSGEQLTESAGETDSIMQPGDAEEEKDSIEQPEKTEEEPDPVVQPEKTEEEPDPVVQPEETEEEPDSVEQPEKSEEATEY